MTSTLKPPESGTTMDKTKTIIPAPVEIVQRWTCNVCGLPCHVVIHTSDDSLPDHLKGNERFRQRGCLVERRLYPIWKRQE